jgi:uncharacterized protein (DUF1330 family)
MPAYLICIRDAPVRDQDSMNEYSRRNRENAAESRTAHHLAPLVVYGALQALEGPAPDGVIVLQFPSAAAARAWYESPAYQAALPFRQKAADYSVFIVDGFAPA